MRGRPGESAAGTSRGDVDRPATIVECSRSATAADDCAVREECTAAEAVANDCTAHGAVANERIAAEAAVGRRAAHEAMVGECTARDAVANEA